MCQTHAVVYSECCHIHQYLVIDPCDGGYVCPLTSKAKCGNENYVIVSYGRDPSEQYCEDCFKQIREGEDRIVEFHLRLHMYFLQLLIDDKIVYAQFSRVIPRLDKSREWACHAHYCKFGLYRAPDWDQVQYIFPTEQQICENKDHIREGLAEAERVGVLQYFTEGENRLAEAERAGVTHYSADGEELMSSDEEIPVPEEVAGAGRENWRRESTSSNEDDHDGEEVVWAGRENWRRDQQVIEPRYHLLA
jgi:hypothetical protein